MHHGFLAPLRSFFIRSSGKTPEFANQGDRSQAQLRDVEPILAGAKFEQRFEGFGRFQGFQAFWGSTPGRFERVVFS